MKHSYSMEGYAFRLRPVKKSDAAFIINVRLEDADRNRFIHAISSDISLEEQWIENYFTKPDDYLFVIENRITREREGIISIYNVNHELNHAEWGRWVIKKGSFAASESVYLLYRIAFEQIGLNELYCETIAQNQAVVSFHNSIGEQIRQVKKNAIDLNGEVFDSVIHHADRNHFYSTIAPGIAVTAEKIFRRMLKRSIGNWTFDHIGVATKSIEKELPTYTLLGYTKDGEIFIDPAQGIRGLFLKQEGHPKLELLQNLDGSDTVTPFLQTNTKMYHRAYYVDDIEKAVEILSNNHAKVISPMKTSVYFKKRICFMMLKNMEMIELLER